MSAYIPKLDTAERKGFPSFHFLRDPSVLQPASPQTREGRQDTVASKESKTPGPPEAPGRQVHRERPREELGSKYGRCRAEGGGGAATRRWMSSGYEWGRA